MPNPIARIYVCAVAGDTAAERTILEGVVLPELRQRATGLGLELLAIDPGRAAENWDLARRFEEIQTCRPFVLGIVGERYGDPPLQVPHQLTEEHLWLAADPGRSVLELEIQEAVLNDPGAAWQSFFYLRDPGFAWQVPEAKRFSFLPESAKAAARLYGLKERIRLSGRPVYDGYPCGWSETLERPAHLDAFAARVTADLWGAIEEEAAW
jgi:hypothetical protein